MPAKKTTAPPKKAPAKTADKPSKSARAVTIDGVAGGERVPSRVLEERIQEAVEAGGREVLIKARGQHGMGGRIWPRGEAVRITIEGPAGQRVGCMGMEGTEIVVRGGASDDAGWINCGARITVLGDVTNGAHNAAAQGVLYVQGGGGARCDTMTKHNPRFTPPQSWYFRDVGDSFAEFKAGGIAVVCGVNPRHPESVLGYRPCVGMVGGVIYFRGEIQGYSKSDVKLLELTDRDWEWLTENMKTFLAAIEREPHYPELTSSRDSWRKLMAHTPQEKTSLAKFPVSAVEFRKTVWEKEVGKGGIFAPYINHDLTILPYITTGENRRNVPIWANEKYAPPCATTCPTGIPSHKRASLIRQGKLKEALDMVLLYSPLPATVCGEICPNLCMQSCTRGLVDRPLNIKEYGRLALEAEAPKPKAASGYKVAVIGGGPGGLSSAWQLALDGHEVSLYEAEDRLGGKVELCIPRDRLPQTVLKKELSRFRELGVHIHLSAKVDRKLFEKIRKENHKVILACGAQNPRVLKFEGSEHSITAYDFLRDINLGKARNLAGKSIVVIGAGNVGMDVASGAFGCGAGRVTAVDVQKPAAFGKEMEMARERGTQILWPRFTEKFDPQNRTLRFKDGSSIEADILVVAIGETPILDFLPPEIHTERGFIAVNDRFQTSDIEVYAVGDATGPGLVTHAIGHGRIVADVIDAELRQYDYMPEAKQAIPYERLKTAYYDVSREQAGRGFNPVAEANVCMSCGACRDCGLCEATCYWGAISRVPYEDGRFEYVADPDKCIGCGFCAGICPCGVWEMAEKK